MMLWDSTGAVFAHVAVCMVLAVTALVALAVVSRARRRAALASLLMVLTCIAAAQVTKRGIALFLHHDATMPSGHATALLAAAVAVVWAVPRRWEQYSAAFSGFLGSFAVAGVVLGGIHVPGDAVAAAGLVLMVTQLYAPFVSGQERGTEYSEGGQWTGLPLLMMCGAATTVLTFIGWGSIINEGAGSWPVVGHLERWGLPLLGGAVVLAAWRAVPATPARTRVGECSEQLQQ